MSEAQESFEDQAETAAREQAEQAIPAKLVPEFDTTCPLCNGNGKVGMPETIGGKVNLLREQLGIEVSEMAELAGLSLSSWRAVERDQAENPSLGTIKAVAKALGVTVGLLLGE